MIRRALTLLMLAPSAMAVAQAPPPPALIATASVAYIEVAPSEVRRTVGILQAYREAAMKAPGIGRIETLQQIGRPNLFAIEETWKDAASLQAHLASAAAKKLRDDLQSALISAFDQRLLAPVTVQASRGSLSDQSIYVLTHADTVDRSGSVPAMLQELAAGARREGGNVLFDVTVQPNRTNHYTLIEAWSDQKAYESHVVAENTKKFRTAFAPTSGALYDERLYKRVN